MNKSTTDTPRTDAFFNRADIEWDDEVLFCRQLERELKMANDEIEFYEKIGQEKVDELRASKAEVERLNHQLLKTESDLLQSQDINSFLSGEYDIANARAKKAEAEVERLRGLLGKWEDRK